MELHNFEELLAMTKNVSKSTMAVAGANLPAAIDAVLDAHDHNIADAILVGEPEGIKELLCERGRNPEDFRIEKTFEGQNPAETAVEFIKSGEANFLLKGLVETTDLFRPVVKKENGLRTGRTISHVAFYQLPFYHKLLITSDGGVCAYPDLQKKKDIIINVVNTLHALGYEKPKVGVLCCKEVEDEKMPETQDAAALQRMAEAGEMGECVVVGPISYDLALRADRAKIKKYACPYSGDFDALISPNIHAGNILGKCLECIPGVQMASYVSGARIPIVLTSRAAPADERLRCIALAGIVASNSK